jgi:hypothetical protein
MRTIGHRLSARGIINHCQRGGYLLKEIRGAQVSFFLEPGSIRARAEFAEEALATGWLVPRDLDLLGEAMSWVYARKGGGDA